MTNTVNQPRTPSSISVLMKRIPGALPRTKTRSRPRAVVAALVLWLIFMARSLLASAHARATAAHPHSIQTDRKKRPNHPVDQCCSGDLNTSSSSALLAARAVGEQQQSGQTRVN